MEVSDTDEEEELGGQEAWRTTDDDGHGFGRLWLCLYRLAKEATVPMTPDRWKELWKSGVPPAVIDVRIVESDSWTNQALILRSIDPVLAGARRGGAKSNKNGGKSNKPGGYELPEARPPSDKVFSLNNKHNEGGGLWPPRITRRPARLTVPEFRVAMTRELSRCICTIVKAAKCRYEVLAPWIDHPAKWDTSEGLLNRMCGTDSKFLNSNAEEEVSNGKTSCAPNDTPTRATADALQADEFVKQLFVTADARTFPTFQSVLRNLGLFTLATLNPALWEKHRNKEVRIEDKQLEMARKHSKAYMARKLFIEAAKKHLDEEARLEDVREGTRKLTEKANLYQKHLEKLRKELFGTTDGTGALLTRLYGLTASSIQLSKKIGDVSRHVFAGVFLGFDVWLTEWLTEISVKKLASTDVIEPLVPPRRMKEVTVEQLAAGMLRRTMEAEQHCAFASLLELRHKLEEKLEKWNGEFRKKIEEVYDTDEVGVRKRRQELVGDETKTRQSVSVTWSERYTGATFPSFADYAYYALVPSEVRDRIEAYRALVKNHLARVQGLPPEDRPASSSPLKPADETLLKRGLSLYAAYVAVRDMLLPRLATPKMRSGLIGCTDLLFGAHLKYAHDHPSVRPTWVATWKGRLTDEHVRALFPKGDGPENGWFDAPKRLYDDTKVAGNPDLGLKPEAFVHPDDIEYARYLTQLYVRRTWSGEAPSWTTWLRKLRPNIEPMVVDSGTTYFSTKETPDWMIVDNPKEDAFMTDEDLSYIGRARTTLPTIELVDDTEEGDPDGAIALVAVPTDEAVELEGEAKKVVEEWLKGDYEHEHNPTKRGYGTPLWVLLVYQVSRTYVARFHPLVEKRGPVAQAEKRLRKLVNLMEEIRATLEGSAMEVSGEVTQPKIRVTEEHKFRVERWKYEMSMYV